jgi:hypothetical protein
VVRDLLVLLDEVELLDQDRVVLEAVLADLEEDLDHEQHALLDRALVEDRPKALEDDVGRLGRVLGQEEADLARERAGNLERVGRRVLLEREEDFERKQLVRDRLIDEVGDERGRCDADGLCRQGSEWGQRPPPVEASLSSRAKGRTLSFRLKARRNWLASRVTSSSPTWGILVLMMATRAAKTGV